MIVFYMKHERINVRLEASGYAGDGHGAGH